MLDSQTEEERKEDAVKLAKAIQSWLDFQILCGREFLLSEAYLGQPLADFLSGRHNGEVVAEENHPAFDQTSGRPQQVDYVLKSPDEGYDSAAIEVKWLGVKGEKKSIKDISKRRIFNDILRLEIMRGYQEGRPVYRYFLLAGGNENFEDFFDLKVRSGEDKPFAKQFLPSPSGNENKKKVRFNEVHDGFVKYFGYYTAYYAGEEKINSKLMPSRIFDVKEMANEKGKKTRVMVWRVKTPGKVNRIDLTNRKDKVPSHILNSTPNI